MSLLDDALAILDSAAPMRLRGVVTEVRGLTLSVARLPAPIGAETWIERRCGAAIRGEVVGFDGPEALVMPLGSTAGVRVGDRVAAGQFAQSVRIGDGVLGRILNGFGDPIDGDGPIRNSVTRPLQPQPIDPLKRPVIDQPLATGVRAIDTLLSVGRGQRLGVFASPGLGKSTLLAMMARQTAADVSVVALVGERGREVREFIDRHLGEDGRRRSVVVCATSDEPAVLRVRAAMVASAVAEHFRDHGQDVLLIMDSVTRLCQAQRQIGLAAGEPPTTRGYPPSTFSMLPGLLERSGVTERGSITGFYSILVEGDDLSEPVADAARGILDGHIVLDRKLARKNHWPAIDVLESISRVADSVTDAAHQDARREVLKLIAAYREVEDLVNIGAYAAGANQEYDLAIAAIPVIDQLLQQGREAHAGSADFQKSRKQLLALVQNIQQAKQQLQQNNTKAAQTA